MSELRFEPLVGGRHGGYVMLDDAVVPRKIHASVTKPDRGPTLSFRLEVTDGRAECTRVQITATPDGRGINDDDVRIPLRALTVQAFQACEVQRPT